MEDRGDLKASRQAHSVDPVRRQLIDTRVIQPDLARGQCEAATDQIDQCGLAGSVRADDGMTLTPGDIKVHAADDLGWSERLGDVPQAESHLGHAALLCGLSSILSFSQTRRNARASKRSATPPPTTPLVPSTHAIPT